MDRARLRSTRPHVQVARLRFGWGGGRAALASAIGQSEDRGGVGHGDGEERSMTGAGREGLPATVPDASAAGRRLRAYFVAAAVLPSLAGFLVALALRSSAAA